MAVRGAVARGVAAGAIGTVALTIAEKAEMRLTGRPASTMPGQVAAKLSGRDPNREPDLVQRLNAITHWTHGVAMGATRGLIDAAGLRPATASAVFYGVVWGGDAMLYRALGLAPEPWNWERRELLTDLYGKGVLAFATSGAYIALDRAI